MNMFHVLFFNFMIFVGIACGVLIGEQWSWIGFFIGLVGAIGLRVLFRFFVKYVL